MMSEHNEATTCNTAVQVTRFTNRAPTLTWVLLNSEFRGRYPTSARFQKGLKCCGLALPAAPEVGVEVAVEALVVLVGALVVLVEAAAEELEVAYV